MRPSSPDLDDLVGRTAGAQPGRRLFHALCGLGIWVVLHYSTVSSRTAVILLVGCFLVALAADLIRLGVPSINRVFFRTFPYLASPRERSHIASSTWYLLGVAGALVLFPRSFAEAGVLVLALADPVASWFGRKYGRRPFGSGSVLGSALFSLVTLILLVSVVGVPTAIGATIVVTLIEAARWPIDDNLSIPLSTAGALWLLSGVLG